MKLFKKINVLLVSLTLLAPSRTPGQVLGLSPAQGAGLATAIVASVLAGYMACALQGNSREDLKYFYGEIAKNVLEKGTVGDMGAIAPCSKYLAKDVIAKLPERINNQPRTFLEVGAGAGIVTASFVNKLQPGDTLDVVELQPELCEILNKKFGHLPNVKIHCTGIEDFTPNKKYTAIVMTVPFNSLPFELVKKIWGHVTSTLLADGGTLSYIYYPGWPTLKKLKLTLKELALPESEKANREKIDFQNIQDHLDGLYKEHGIGNSYELRNCPLVCTRYLQFNHKPEQANSQTQHYAAVAA